MDILVIDDEMDICEILTSLFKDHGYDTGFALDAVMARQIIDVKHPSLLICDITMPGTSGIELLEEIKSKGQMFGVVMLTAHSESEVIIQALQLGAIDYLVKPFETASLMEKLPGWIEIGRRLQDLASGQGTNAALLHKRLQMVELFRLKNKKFNKKAS